ncbi:MAG: oligosaccharide flippase family protein [Candidatus Diapherotrites archaeon]|nr:oligosaccharide flippase family protein [Candidatus Diapherotrites archaeon]
MVKEFNLREIRKGLFWLVLGNLALFVSGFLVYIILGKYFFSPAEFGVYGIIISLATVFTTIFKNSFLQTLSHFVAVEKKGRFSVVKKVFFVQFSFSLFLFVVFFVWAENVAAFFNDASFAHYIRLISFVFPFSALYALGWGYLNGMKKFKEESILQIVYNFSKTVLVLLLAVVGFGVFGSVAGFVLASVVAALLSIFFVFKNRDSKQQSNISFKQVIYYSAPLIMIAIFIQLFETADLFLIKAILKDNYFSGIYVAVQTISKLPHMVVLAIPFLLFPFVSAAASEKDVHSIGKISRNSLKYSTMFLVLCISVVASSPKEILLLLFNQGYAIGANALIILSVGMAFFALCMILNSIATSAKKLGLSVGIMFLMLLLDVILNLFLIPLFGIEGAAAATAISSIFGFILFGFFYGAKVGGFFSFKTLTKILFAGAVVFLISAAFPFQGILFVIKGAVLSIGFVLILFLFGEIDFNRIIHY